MTDNRALKLKARLSSKITGDKYTVALDKLQSRQGQITLQNSFSDADASLLKSFVYSSIHEYGRKPVQAGNVLFTGLSGSGKTTAMAAVLKDISQNNNHLATVDNGHEISDIVQPQQNYIALSLREQTSSPPMTQLQILRYVMRMVTDTVAVDEIRDKDVMDEFFRMSQAGFQMMATMHGTDYGRIAQMIPDVDRLESLTGIVQSKRIYIEGFGSYFLHAVIPLDRKTVNLIQDGRDYEVEQYLASQNILTIRAKIRDLVKREILTVPPVDVSENTEFGTNI